jgi:uncharacterized protein YndB with AHSA1/START domain
MPDPRPASAASAPGPAGPPSFVLSTVVDAPVARVMQAFFSHTDLAYWWEADRSVTVARPSGPYAVTWKPSENRDAVLGQLGGTLHGTVMDYTPDRALFVADVYWQPPEAPALGPMALEITCQPEADPAKTKVTVRQSASEDGPRWQRYFSLTREGWTVALCTLKDYIENEWLYRLKTIKQARP